MKDCLVFLLPNSKDAKLISFIVYLVVKDTVIFDWMDFHTNNLTFV